MDDTLDAWRAYEQTRLEFDAERTEYDTVRRTAKAGTRLHTAEISFATAEANFARARDSVATKLALLEANKVKVMKKQLSLFHNAMVAYFTGCVFGWFVSCNSSVICFLMFVLIAPL